MFLIFGCDAATRVVVGVWVSPGDFDFSDFASLPGFPLYACLRKRWRSLVIITQAG
jgi:hypothetical protein